MEVNGDSLVWRTACQDTALTESEASKLLEQIDMIAAAMIDNPEAPAIEFQQQGISVCGLPTFKETKSKSMKGGEHQHQESNSTPSEWSSLELSIRSILAAVAHVPESEITRTITIFHLGLDSISAIKVSSMLRKQSIILSVSEMLRAATVEKMALVAKHQHLDVDVQTLDTNSSRLSMLSDVDTLDILKKLKLPSGDVERIMPATSGQALMLGTWQNSKGAVFYPEFTFRAQGDLDRRRLGKAWSELSSQLPILRTVFCPTEKESVPYVQMVLKSTDNPIRWHPEPVTRRSEQPAEPNKRSSMASPVSLSAYESSGEVIVVLQIHHALYDGVSLPKLMESLGKLYNDPHATIESNLDLGTFIAFTHAHSAEDKRKDFWKMYLPNGERRHLKSASTAPDTKRIELYRPELIEDAGCLERLAKRCGISIQALFIAAWAKIYAGLLSSSEADATVDEIIIGIYLANRSHDLEGLPNLIAPTVNIVPLCVTNPSQGPLIGIAQRVQTDLHEIGRVEYSCVSLIEIKKWTGITIDCFVNFLKLPGENEEVESDRQDIRFEEISHARDGSGVSSSYSEEEDLELLHPNLVRDVFLV